MRLIFDNGEKRNGPEQKPQSKYQLGGQHEIDPPVLLCFVN
jgi:hypothetical protein